MRSSRTEPVYGLSEVLASCQQDHAVVAVLNGAVIGAAVGRAAHAQGWIVFLSTIADQQDNGIGARLPASLEKRMLPLGLSKLSVLLPDTATRVDAFISQGFSPLKNLRYFERQIPVQREELSVLADLGGRLLPRRLWDAIGGMHAEKDLLERRLVLPLARADLAAPP